MASRADACSSVAKILQCDGAGSCCPPAGTGPAAGADRLGAMRRGAGAWPMGLRDAGSGYLAGMSG